MSGENLTPPSVAELLRTTGVNQSAFLDQVAQHIEQLEMEVVRLTNRVKDLENGTANKSE